MKARLQQEVEEQLKRKCFSLLCYHDPSSGASRPGLLCALRSLAGQLSQFDVGLRQILLCVSGCLARNSLTVLPRLVSNLWQSCPSLPSIGIIGMTHHARFRLL